MVIWFIALGILLCLESKSQTVVDVTDDCVKWHNHYRTSKLSSPLPPVSADAAASAQAYSFMSQRSGTACAPFEHSRAKGFGENLYSGTVADCQKAVAAWYSELQYYKYEEASFGYAGHFTQVMWETSTKIGCAMIQNCPSHNNQLVCNYSPPGNYIGRKPFSKEVLSELQSRGTEQFRESSESGSITSSYNRLTQSDKVILIVMMMAGLIILLLH